MRTLAALGAFAYAVSQSHRKHNGLDAVRQLGSTMLRTFDVERREMEALGNLTVELPTRRATMWLGRWLAAGAQSGDLVILSGDLGAGKTFLARSMARSLGVPTDVRITSPTFTLVHHFPTSPPVVHADLYRIGDASEVDQLILREARADGAVLVVEWGEPYLRELGGDALIVHLGLLDKGRVARLTSSGPRSAESLDRPLPSKLVVRPRSKSE